MLACAPQVRNGFFQKIICYTNYQVALNWKIITTYIHYKRVVSTNILSYWHTSGWSAPNANYLLAMDKNIFVHFASIPQFASMTIVVICCSNTFKVNIENKGVTLQHYVLQLIKLTRKGWNFITQNGNRTIEVSNCCTSSL